MITIVLLVAVLACIILGLWKGVWSPAIVVLAIVVLALALGYL